MQEPPAASSLIAKYVLCTILVALAWPFVGGLASDTHNMVDVIFFPYRHWLFSLSLIALWIWRKNIAYLIATPWRKKAQEEKERQIVEKRAKELAFEKEQNAKGLFKFENKWGTPEQVKEWKEHAYGISQNFMNMSHFQFEEFVAKLFREMAYTTHVTKKTGDFGIDVIARKDGKTTAIQCKQNKMGNNVGAVIVQNTLGSMWKVKADKSIIVTTSDFTTQAEEQAKGAPIELWDGSYLKKMIRKYFIDEHEEDETKRKEGN